MRAIVKNQSGPGLDLVDVPMPEPGPGEVLIEVKAGSICGTDLHIDNWDDWAAEHVCPPVVVGHEMCGIVRAHGAGVTEPALGTLVSVESHVICERCAWCRTGRGHLCPNTEILGVHRHGVFAEYAVVPAVNAWIDPPDMPFSIASLQENFGNAVHTASTPNVAGRKVLVTGCGPVGVMAIAAAKALGARSVIATDVNEVRLALAKTMGADLALDATSDVSAAVLEATDGEGVDVVLEMSGSAEALDQGMRLLKPGGEAALLGLHPSPVHVDLDDTIIFKGATVYGVVGRRLWDTWFQMRAMLRSGAVDLTPLVTARFALDDYRAAFDLMASGDSGKVILFPNPSDADGPLTKA